MHEIKMNANLHRLMNDHPVPRQRRPGGGRKRKLDTLEGSRQHIVELVQSRENVPFQWTFKSLDELAAELRTAGVEVSRNIVSKVLREEGFQLSPNRKLPNARGSCDVDSQFEIVNKAVMTQLGSGGPVILLMGDRVDIAGKFIGAESIFHYTPNKIASLDNDFEQVVHTLPDGTLIPGVRERSEEERFEVIQRKRNATVLPLDALLTDRDGGLFTAAVLEHWWCHLRRPHFSRKDHLLLLTHGGSPDCVSPGQWEWAMDRLSKKLAITITVGRLPPAIWQCTIPYYPLFSFAWRRPNEKVKNGFTVKGSLLCQTDGVCDEIKSIPPIGRHYPKTRKNISSQVRQGFDIHRDPQYGDWNYSFIGNQGNSR